MFKHRQTCSFSWAKVASLYIFIYGYASHVLGWFLGRTRPVIGRGCTSIGCKHFPSLSLVTYHSRTHTSLSSHHGTYQFIMTYELACHGGITFVAKQVCNTYIILQWTPSKLKWYLSPFGDVMHLGEK